MSMSPKRTGRPFGTSAGQSGKGLMTAYTRNFTNSRTLKVSGKKATSNGISQLKGRVARTKGAWGQHG
jgi:hypothetical protein